MWKILTEGTMINRAYEVMVAPLMKAINKVEVPGLIVEMRLKKGQNGRVRKNLLCHPKGKKD